MPISIPRISMRIHIFEHIIKKIELRENSRQALLIASQRRIFHGRFIFFYILFIFSYYAHSVEFCTFKFPTYKCTKFRSLLIRFVRNIIDIEDNRVVTYDENRENDRKLWYLINVIEALRSCLNRHEYMNQQLLRV